MDGQELAKQTLDQIPQANANAKRIIGLVKEGGRISDYKLSDETFVSKPDAVSMAKQGQIAGIGIAHRGDTEYLKDIPTGIRTVCPQPYLPYPISRRQLRTTGRYRQSVPAVWTD